MFNIKITEDYRKSLIQHLYSNALVSNVFAKQQVLIGMGAFEGCFESQEEELNHYHDFVNHFEEAIGKRFLGSTLDEPEATASDYAPDKNLPEAEYNQALLNILYAAQNGCEEADDWEIFFPSDEAYSMRMTYAEILAYNEGCNAWQDWLDEMLDIKDENEAEAFMQEALVYHHEEFFKMARELRKMMEEAVKAVEDVVEE